MYCRSQNFQMFAGDDLRIIVPVVDERTREPIDISQATSIKWSMARTVGATTPVLEKELDNGITINNPTSFFFDITNVESSDLTGNYYHEAEVITSQGYVYTVLSGRAYVQKTLI